MPLIINTNTSASIAASNLSASNAMLQKSLARLSSGSKIVNPSDDAGGLAVSMRLEAAMARSDAAQTGLANATSFLQVQDGALKNAAKVLTRIAELKTLSTDVTKNTTDVANYDKEFAALQAELTATSAVKFNGVSVFGAGGGTLTVTTSEDGAQSMTVSKADFAAAVSSVTSAANLAAVTVTGLDNTLTSVAGARAQNGAEGSRLNFAIEMLSTNRQNLESANSRIVDTDVAAESTRLARSNILVQAGSAMLAQANTSNQSVLRLLQG
jgi:flagellin